MRLALLAGLFFFISLSSSSQLSPFLEQIKKYGIKNGYVDFDTAMMSFDIRLQNNLHYLFPLYGSLINEQRMKSAYSNAHFYDNASQYISFTGDYYSAIQFAVRGYEVIDSSKLEMSRKHADEFKELVHVDAKKYILDKAKDQRVVMINEAHCKPLHRAFTLSLLSDLYNQGFRYFAMEAFDNYSEKSLKQVNANTGHYIAEPVAAELTRQALSLGYKLVSYEDTLRHTGSQRDSVQAANIYKILKKDPAAKILVHAGYGHIAEEAFGDGYVPMGLAFKRLSGIDPFTIDQTEMTEGSNYEYGRVFYEHYLKNYPLQIASVAFQKNRVVSPLDNTGFDLTIIHPKTVYKNGRSTWYSFNGLRKEIPVQPVEKNLFMVQAYYATEYTEKKQGLAIPADQTYIPAENGYYYLYLLTGKYKLIYRDINYQILNVKDIEVK